MSVTRREFLVSGTAVALAIGGSPQSPGGSASHTASASRASGASGGESGPESTSRTPTEPVVSFHLDRPYLDLTGLETPYIPPAGMRSGAPLAALGEEELSRFYGFI
jgi:hypothetical protein